jgi:hypothetical protein
VSESGYDNCRKDPWRHTTQCEPENAIQKWLGSPAKKPFGVLAEGLVSENSRSDRNVIKRSFEGGGSISRLFTHSSTN